MTSLSGLSPRLATLQEKLARLRASGALLLQNGDLGVASAPSNIALLKYWGKVPGARQIPVNSSVSFTLGGFRSFTRVRVRGRFYPQDDGVTFQRPAHHFKLAATDGAGMATPGGLAPDCTSALASLPVAEAAPDGRPPDEKMQRWLDTCLAGWGDDVGLAIESINNFPTACGIASSASGYAALTAAVADLCQLRKHFSPEDLSFWLAEWSRLGSGSATRSSVEHDDSAFVAWQAAASLEKETHTFRLAAHPLWQTLRHAVLVLDDAAKETSSSSGHLTAASSPLQTLRLAGITTRFVALQKALAGGDFARVAALTEEDAFAMHAVMLSATPPARYLTTSTAEVIAAFVRLRDAMGASACWTIDAGPNVHLLYLPEAEPCVTALLREKGARCERVLFNRYNVGLALGLEATEKLEKLDLLDVALPGRPS